MSLTLDLQIVICGRGHETRVPLVALAAVFHVPVRTLEERLLALVEGIRRRTEGERTEGEIDRSTREVQKESDRSIEEREGPGEREVSVDLDRLIHALGDEAGRAALRRLIAGVPGHLVEMALARTLAIPADRIEKSRAAYFSVVLRGLRQAPPH